MAGSKGVSAAVRSIPYGIRQPAVSSQVRRLERDLRTRLFHRRPFALTPAGTRLFASIAPFFASLARLGEAVGETGVCTLRLAAPQPVLKEHLPDLLQATRRKFPGLRVILREITQAAAWQLLEANEVDLAICLFKRIPAGFRFQRLVGVPLVLVVPAASRFRSAEEFFKQDEYRKHSLISFSSNSHLTDLLQRELARRRIAWPVQIEVDSTELVQTYVARGFGMGLALAIPGLRNPAGLRQLPLRGMAPAQVGAFWKYPLNPAGACFLAEAERKAARMLQRRARA